MKPPLEIEEQTNFFTQLRLIYPDVESHTFSIANGAHLAKYQNKSGGTFTQINSLKASGLKPGVPDIFIVWPRAGYHGCFIEMKRIGGEGPRPEQVEWLDRLGDINYACFVAFGADHAFKCLEKYLELK